MQEEADDLGKRIPVHIVEQTVDMPVGEAFDVPVPQIQEEIVEMFQFPPQERTSERTVEQIVDVSVPVP